MLRARKKATGLYSVRVGGVLLSQNPTPCDAGAGAQCAGRHAQGAGVLFKSGVPSRKRRAAGDREVGLRTVDLSFAHEYSLLYGVFAVLPPCSSAGRSVVFRGIEASLLTKTPRRKGRRGTPWAHARAGGLHSTAVLAFWLYGIAPSDHPRRQGHDVSCRPPMAPSPVLSAACAGASRFIGGAARNAAISCWHRSAAGRLGRCWCRRHTTRAARRRLPHSAWDSLTLTRRRARLVQAPAHPDDGAVVAALVVAFVATSTRPEHRA
jgi:hypothetical protein